MACACDTKGFLEGLQLHLKDCDGVRWTDGYLGWVMEIAARQLQSDRKDLFKEDKRIKLEIGCYTGVCKQGCQEISQPFRNETDECKEIEVVSSDDDWISAYFPVIKCASDSDAYSVDRIETDLEDPCTIKVTPPVPDDGKAYWVIAKCQKDVCAALSSGSLPDAICTHVNAFTQLVLFYAYSMDSMVNVDMSQAQRYFENYTTLMQLTYLNDLSAREKTIYLKQLIDRSKSQGT